MEDMAKATKKPVGHDLRKQAITAIDKLKEATGFLKSHDIEDAEKESEIIIIHSLKIDKVTLYRDNPTLSKAEIKKIDSLLERRAKREPLQYILGYVDFYGLKIKVDPGVLIPRPETEQMAEEVIKIVRSQKLPPHPPLSKGGTKEGVNILDLCTGSGCLALALAKAFQKADVYGTDISAKAVKCARENAEINNIKNATFLKGSLFEPVKRMPKFDLIVSNPPYIESADISGLQPEIKDWEPTDALDGGEDGLKYYREILKDAKRYLAENGLIFLELGYGQAEAVAESADRNGFKNISFIKDFCDILRIARISA